ncbi:MAG: metalloregulator ArsR/SmtB family transcription factor [Alphaproteobacteria bacterium]|jgi:DNA-binding transcriptional ArsR family regulator|nr:metalloregulator ArsR/SmtB family transcription factor [Alphaproteobacteria bacterium]
MTTEIAWAGPASVLFRSLSNEYRLQILHYLMEGEKSIDQLAELIGVSRTQLPQHMVRLQRDNLITSRREERFLFYSLVSEEVPRMLEAARHIFSP